VKVGDLVRFRVDYPSGHPYGVGMIVGYSEDMSHPPVRQSGENILWRVLWAGWMEGWIRTDQLRVIDESG
jgi:hypothetical protein